MATDLLSILLRPPLRMRMFGTNASFNSDNSRLLPLYLRDLTKECKLCNPPTLHPKRKAFYTHINRIHGPWTNKKQYKNEAWLKAKMEEEQRKQEQDHKAGNVEERKG